MLKRLREKNVEDGDVWMLGEWRGLDAKEGKESGRWSGFDEDAVQMAILAYMTGLKGEGI